MITWNNSIIDNPFDKQALLIKAQDMTKKIGLLLFTLLLAASLPAQSLDQDKLRDAKVFFGHQRYAEALVLLSSSRQLSRVDKEARFLMAICQYQTNKLEDALNTLSSLTSDDKAPYPECWLYLAKIYHAQHRFKEASDVYKSYLRSIFPNDPNRPMVVEEIRRCANGIELMFQSSPTVVENLGPGVNSEEDEFAPIASPNHADRLYFSAVRSQNTGGRRDAYGNIDNKWGNFYADLFTSEVKQGIWGQATPMHYLLNSPKHELLLGFSQDGQALYYFKGWDLKHGEIVVDTFRRVEDRTMSSTPLPGPLRTDQGDSYPVFYQDTLMFFSSNRPGGYGGWDLYKCSKVNGRWLQPVNLGPIVNTAFDETTPFLANDGQTLYFSSNDSYKSMGGLDVFKTFFIPQRNLWLPPKNVGLPINSAADDAFFKISHDGFTAYFASSRKDGYGKWDVYAALFQDFLPEMEYPEGYHKAEIPPPPREFEYPNVPVPPTQPDPVPVQPQQSGNPDSNNFTPGNQVEFDEQPRLQEQPPVNRPPDPTPPKPLPAATSGYSAVLLEGGGPSAGQYDMLDQISDQLIRRSDLLLVLTAYNEKVGATGEALFSAINKAEAVARYLQRKGVSGSQIFMRGALENSPGIKSGQVELAFTTASGRTPEGDFPVLDGTPNPLFSNQLINEPLHFKIQVASAQRAIRDSYLEGFPDPMIEKTPDFPYYRYTLGAFTDRTEAERFRQKMKDNGRTSAFLATYRQGWRMER